MANKKTNPLVWVGLVAVGICAYVWSSSPPPPKNSRTSKPNTAKSTKADDYTKADYAAKFARLKLASADSFRPIVKSSVGAPAAGPTGTVGIPITLTGGEPGWSFTGDASVNGIKEALVENSNTGDGEFLKEGQSWKQARVESIGQDSLELRGPDGTLTTLKLGDPVSEPATIPGFSPLSPRPTLSGQIGNVTVVPAPPTGAPAGRGQG